MRKDQQKDTSHQKPHDTQRSDQDKTRSQQTGSHDQHQQGKSSPARDKDDGRKH